MNPRAPLDLRCYFVTGAATDRASANRVIVETAAAAARGGAGIIQVRSKPISARDLYALSREVARAVAAANPATRVLIDDRLDIALALRHDGEAVHGVHVGQDDIPVRTCRQLLGEDAIIGLTTGTRELVTAANADAHYLDYIGCGPFRATPTKDSGRPPLGLSGYDELAALSQVPMVAIGDITLADVPALARTGIAGVAVVRALMNADNPEDYAARIRAEFDRGAANTGTTHSGGGTAAPSGTRRTT